MRGKEEYKGNGRDRERKRKVWGRYNYKVVREGEGRRIDGRLANKVKERGEE